MKIDCLEFVEKIRSQHDLSTRKNLAIIQVGDNDASNLYIKSKYKEANKWNVGVVITRLPTEFTTNEIIKEIEFYNNSNMIDGIIVQLPLPKHVDTQRVIDAIRPTKNVDGFKQTNKPKYYDACTPKGIMMLLDNMYGNKLEGKTIALLGRGKTVGEPLREMLLERNVTLVLCNSYTTKSSLASALAMADIVISAIGKPCFIKLENVIFAETVIDAGISRVDGKQVGDFDNREVFAKSKFAYTPWTNGVGKLTVMALMLNVRKEV